MKIDIRILLPLIVPVAMVLIIRFVFFLAGSNLSATDLHFVAFFVSLMGITSGTGAMLALYDLEKEIGHITIQKFWGEEVKQTIVIPAKDVPKALNSNALYDALVTCEKSLSVWLSAEFGDKDEVANHHAISAAREALAACEAK